MHNITQINVHRQLIQANARNHFQLINIINIKFHLTRKEKKNILEYSAFN